LRLCHPVTEYCVCIYGYFMCASLLIHGLYCVSLLRGDSEVITWVAFTYRVLCMYVYTFHMCVSFDTWSVLCVSSSLRLRSHQMSCLHIQSIVYICMHISCLCLFWCMFIYIVYLFFVPIQKWSEQLSSRDGVLCIYVYTFHVCVSIDSSSVLCVSSSLRLRHKIFCSRSPWAPHLLTSPPSSTASGETTWSFRMIFTLSSRKSQKSAWFWSTIVCI